MSRSIILLAGLGLALSFLIAGATDASARTLTKRERVAVAKQAGGSQWRAVYEIMDIESDFDTDAHNPSGAFGLFQHMPETRRLYGRKGHRRGNVSDQIAVERAYIRARYADSWWRALSHLKVKRWH